MESAGTETVWENDKTEIEMATIATNNFRNIVMILSVKEEYGDQLLAQLIICRTLLFIYMIPLHTLIPAIFRLLELSGFPADIFRCAG